MMAWQKGTLAEEPGVLGGAMEGTWQSAMWEDNEFHFRQPAFGTQGEKLRPRYQASSLTHGSGA